MVFVKAFIILSVVLISSVSLNALDQFPELNTLDGKAFKQVKVMKVSPTEIRIMHADGFATIPLSALPPEVRSKYGEANPEAEAAAAMQRKTEGQASAAYQRQEKEAIQAAELSHQSIEVCRQAIVMRDWCQANSGGGIFNGKTMPQEIRDKALAEALAVLARRPGAADVVAMAPPAGKTPEAVAATTVSTTSAAPAAGAFQPGVIELVSARYSLPGNQPRNVKNRLQKFIPTTPISAPISILVSDDLSDAAKAQGNFTTSVGIGASVTATDSATVGVAVVQSQTNKNMLTVEYIFNGVRLRKQAVEGSQLVLP